MPTFFNSPHIANLPILGLPPLAKNCKFLRCASPQVANPHILWLIRKSQIRKFPQNTT